MKTIALIPYWSKYQFPDSSIKDRDMLKVGGHSLLERAIKLCNEIEQVQDVVIYTSNIEISKYIDDEFNYQILQRDPDLDSQGVSIETIIDSFLELSDAELIVLMHPRCPFISANSVQECIERVSTLENDSAFVATSHRKLGWYAGQPLNYNLEPNIQTPNIANIEPIVLESSALYVFTRSLFKKTKRRIGNNPFIKNIGKYEGFDIESEDDFEIADLLINAGFDKESR